MSCFGGDKKKKPVQAKKPLQSQIAKPQAEKQNRNDVRQATNVSIKMENNNERGNDRKPTLTQMERSQLKSLRKVDIEYQTSTNRQQEDLVFRGMNAVKMDLAVYCRQPEQLIRNQSYFDESRSDPKVAPLQRTGLASYRTQDNADASTITVKRMLYDNDAKCIV